MPIRELIEFNPARLSTIEVARILESRGYRRVVKRPQSLALEYQITWSRTHNVPKVLFWEPQAQPLETVSRHRR